VRVELQTAPLLDEPLDFGETLLQELRCRMQHVLQVHLLHALEVVQQDLIRGNVPRGQFLHGAPPALKGGVDLPSHAVLALRERVPQDEVLLHALFHIAKRSHERVESAQRVLKRQPLGRFRGFVNARRLEGALRQPSLRFHEGCFQALH
jgi:hypothetical protein